MLACGVHLFSSSSGFVPVALFSNEGTFTAPANSSPKKGNVLHLKGLHNLISSHIHGDLDILLAKTAMSGKIISGNQKFWEKHKKLCNHTLCGSLWETNAEHWQCIKNQDCTFSFWVHAMLGTATLLPIFKHFRAFEMNQQLLRGFIIFSLG